MYFQSKNPHECCGCSACVHSCPVSAISFVSNDEGFDYPEINEDQCIHCGLCQRVCPVEHPQYNNSFQPKVYAAINKDDQIRQKSSSGGVFTLLASWIIRQGGIVFGATMDSSLKVKHIGVETLEDLTKLRGSKYVQSDLGDVFSVIRQQLLNERWVYFVGTGCQVAGLHSYLKKRYRTLLVSDLVCHGVPSQKLFDNHISYIEDKYSGKVLDYRFRDVKKWGGCEIVKLVKPNGRVRIIKHPTYDLSPFLYSFMNSFTLRYSCYECEFAKIPRQGDITLADFWGVKKYFPQLDTSKGVSLVLVNNAHGESIIKEVEGDCELIVSNLQDAAAGNENLVHHSSMPSKRQHVFGKIDEYGYASIAKTEFRSPRFYKVLIASRLDSLGLLKPLQKIKQRLFK